MLLGGTGGRNGLTLPRAEHGRAAANQAGRRNCPFRIGSSCHHKQGRSCCAAKTVQGGGLHVTRRVGMFRPSHTPLSSPFMTVMEELLRTS